MDELLDLSPDVHVLETEYKRLLGYPPHHEVDDRVQELIAKTRQWYAEHGKPWVYARKAGKLELKEGRFLIDGIQFTSKRVLDMLREAGADQAIIVAVSAGKGCEERANQLWLEEKPDEYFFMEMYGSAVVENLITTTGARLCAWADQQKMAVLPHYSPGYPEWSVSEQHKLFELLKQKNGAKAFPREIFVMESGMLNPKKSLLAVFGVTNQLDKVQHLSKLVPCENCALESCSYRRVPYKRSIQQIENINDLSNNTITNGANAALNHNASYKINAKALQKWTRERVKLNVLEDRCIEAQFRYEGTTCSNTGRPLEFLYRIKLSSAEDEYKILEASCAPAPADTGHTYMCQYIKDGKQLMATIENEKPLLGKPLNTILDWNYASSPAACYCAAASREHKWGIVFQTLHYAMVEFEKQQ